jgi:hypothetical protein
MWEDRDEGADDKGKDEQGREEVEKLFEKG